MPTGGRNLQFNTLERALSSDLNRLQRLAGGDLSALLKLLVGHRSTQGLAAASYSPASGFVLDDADAGSGAAVADPTTTSTPLTADIFEGFLVRPVPSTLTMTVDPGVMTAVVPDGDPDASATKLVVDPGQPLAGQLLVPQNLANTDAWYIVEAIPALNAAVETRVSDIFNDLTGQFTPTPVTKVQAYLCTYQIRVFTNAFPTLAQGALPLALIYAPGTFALAGGSLVTDQMTFYDVRPLISDRDNSLSGISNQYPTVIGENQFSVSGGNSIVGTAARLFRGRRVGGWLTQGSPVVGTRELITGSPTPFQPFALNNRDQSAGTPSSLGYLYYVFPLGLPRFSRYMNQTDANALGVPRLPRSPRGLPVSSPVVPDIRGVAGNLGLGLGGVTQANPLSLPAWLCSPATHDAVCFGSFEYNTATTAFALVAEDRATFLTDDQNVEGVFLPNGANSPPTTIAVPLTFLNVAQGVTASTLIYESYIVPGVTVPIQAKTVKLRVNFSIEVPVAETFTSMSAMLYAGAHTSTPSPADYSVARFVLEPGKSITTQVNLAVLPFVYEIDVPLVNGSFPVGTTRLPTLIKVILTATAPYPLPGGYGGLQTNLFSGAGPGSQANYIAILGWTV